MIHRLACLAFALTGIAVSAQTPARYDVVIRGGRIVDGTAERATRPPSRRRRFGEVSL